jgi:dTMP kinase
MFVVFEGIDGSGKTTISNLVAQRLRERGLPVEHVREGGTFASPLVTRLREFGKDTRNLGMAPLTELLLYAARDAQLIAECIRPALERGSLVFSDRYLYSYEVLSHYGRSMPIEQVRTIIDAVADGLWPELVVLIDVDPHVARARRQVSKLIQKGAIGHSLPDQPIGGSRKGLQGLGNQHRLREGYLTLARQDPERWLVVNNSTNPARTGSSLSKIVNDLADAITRHWQSQSRSSIPVLYTGPDSGALSREAIPLADFDAGRDAFYRAVRARAIIEVPVAAYFLARLDDERAYGLREEWADQAPDAIAYGLRGLGDKRAWALRERLVARTPYHVARSLEGPEVDGEQAERMRARLFESQPAAVLSTLDGNDGDAAWEIRERLADSHMGRVVASLKDLDTERAWSLRDYYWSLIGAENATDPKALSRLIDSLRGLGGERAWGLRERYLELLPVAVLGSLFRLEDDRAWELRQRFVEQAPKVVLRTFDGSRDERAWELRAEYAPKVKESLGSMVGLDDDDAWGIREACREIWPSTTVKSLGVLGLRDRGREMALETLVHHPGNISLLKHITRLAVMAERAGEAGTGRAS